MTAHFRSPTETALCRVFHFGERGELRFNFNVPDCGQAEDPAMGDERGGWDLVEGNEM